MSTTPEEFKEYLGASETTRLGVFEMLMRTVPVGVWYTNEDGEVLYVNDGWEKVTGMSFEHIKGTSYTEIIHPADLAITFERMRNTVATHDKYEVTFRMRKSSRDSYRWFYSRALWSPKHNGFPAGMIGITMDVTETHVLETTSKMLWLCMEQVQHSVVITDAINGDNPIIYVNKAFKDLTQYTTDEVLGRNPRFMHNGDGEQPVIALMRDAIAAGNSISNVVVRNYKRDSSMYFVELYLSPIYIDGVITYWVGFQVPVTERVKRVEIEELGDVVNRMLRLSASKGECVCPVTKTV